MEPSKRISIEESVKSIIGKCDIKEVTDIIVIQRLLAVNEYKKMILNVIDSQTHSSDLSDTLRFVRKLIEDI